MPFMCGLFTIIGLSFTMAIIQNVGKVFETQVLGTDDDEEGEEEGVEGGEGDRRGSVCPPPKLEGILEIDENPIQQSAGRSPKSLQHGDSHI